MLESKFDFSAFSRAIDRIGSTFARPAEVIRRPVEDWLAETEREQFRTQGAAGASGRWQPLSPATLRRKVAEGRGPRILERTGAMQELLTNAGSLRQLIEVSGDKIIFRLPPPATFHQTGTRRMPRRQVYAPNAEQKRRLGEGLRREATERMQHEGVRVKGSR